VVESLAASEDGGLRGNGIMETDDLSSARFLGDLEGEAGGLGGARKGVLLGDAEAMTRVREDIFEPTGSFGRSANGIFGMVSTST